ncbi:MAG TPA: ATP-binding protein [Rectinemataceae bacterium]|nr:ATP-binding protein [Rectinemataceae bacterium]
MDGLSTTEKIVLGVALLLFLSITGRAVLDIYGLRVIGYSGRGDYIYADMAANLDHAMDDTRRAMILWFIRAEDDAKAISAELGRSRALLSGGGLPGTRAELGKDLAQSLQSGLLRNSAYREILLLDRARGTVLASSSGPPSLSAVDPGSLSEARQAYLLPNGRWLLAFPTGMDGLWLGIAMDPSPFLNQISRDSAVPGIGFEWTLLGPEGRVVATSDQKDFPVSMPAFSEADLRKLFTSDVAKVGGDRGLFAMASEPLPVAQVGTRLVVSVDAATFERPLRAETGSSIALNVVFGLFAIVLTWVLASRVFRPFQQLSEAVRIFAEGGSPDIPEHSKGEIGFLSKAFADLIAQVSKQRQSLEREIDSRTSDLVLRSAVIRAFALAANDGEAYHSMLAILRGGLGVETGLIVYFDGRGVARVVYADDRGSLSLDEEQLEELGRAAESAGGPAPVLGEDFGGCLGMRQTIGDDVVGFVLLLRRESRFHPREAGLLRRALDDLAPLFYERRERSRQEETRTAAEKALRRSEERLRAFFEESRDMIYTANAEDTIASINAAGLKLLGFTDRFDVVGRKFSEMALSPEDRENFLRELRERSFVNDYEIVLKKSDGGTLFCIETAHTIRAGDGSIVEIQGSVKDISERISKERELWRTNLELAGANARLKETQMLVVQREKLASIGQLAAGIAHEINNPLGFLKSNHEALQKFLKKLRTAWEEASARDPATHAEIARRMELDYVFAEIEAIVDESDDGYRRIIEIVKNLRNFARDDARGDFGTYDIEAGIRSTLIVARNEIKYVATVRLEFAGLPTIVASGGEINQVLLNIVMNAAQAIQESGKEGLGQIVITTGLENDRVVLTIEDDGPGIPEEHALRVFDPFFTTKAPGKGTGLGLSISYDIIVNKHEGSLSVGSSPLGGASFRIELPCKGPSAAAAAAGA